VEDSDFPDPKRLRAFDAVARLGSLVAAGKHLRISQPAVTYLIKQLEADFDVRLLERSASGSELNDNGRAFGDRTVRFFDAQRSAVEALLGPSRSERRCAAIAERMTRTQCRGLLAVWRHGDLTSSSQRLGVQSQAVLRSIRSLEQLSSMPLLEHAAGRVQLNAAGHEFSRRLALAAQEIASGLKIIGSGQAQKARSLRIGALVLSPRLILAEAVEACAGSDPRQSLEITEGSYEELVVMLRSGSIDLIFGALRDPPPYDDLAELRLHEDPYVVACRRGHPLSKKKRIGPEDLADAQFVIPTSGLRQSVMEELLGQWNVTARHQIYTSWLPTLMALVRSSDRLAILSQWHIDADGAHELQALESISVPHKRRYVGVTTRSSWLPTPFQEDFLGNLKRVVQTHLP
jgi:LysR family transcriptional regulator of gallate degradation